MIQDRLVQILVFNYDACWNYYFIIKCHIGHKGVNICVPEYIESMKGSMADEKSSLSSTKVLAKLSWDEAEFFLVNDWGWNCYARETENFHDHVEYAVDCDIVEIKSRNLLN